MLTKNYNVMTLSINEALNHVPFGTGGGYIKLLKAPTSANVLIHLNDSNADGIPLKAYHEIEASNIDKVFISCNAVDGETIEIVQAKTSKDFKMITPVSDIAVDEIGGYSATALALLDKVIKPYNIPTLSIAQTNNSGITTLLNKTLTSDKILINLSYGNGDGGQYQSGIVAKLDGVLVCGQLAYASGLTNSKTTLEDIKGKTLTIEGRTGDSTVFVAFSLQEYTLK